ncbi:VOC family protein [Rhodococcus sp. ACPA4]|uniref:VOC family protein n=1 Tax=Rhodococcus TaxID=1827 RepID=UPI0005D32C15|nr:MULTISPECIES: VOC family protein [unclassified Rhodococcus (in: high G+C Gram-positive bacteria)]KJF24635.1 Glyoxalase-like domain protein [Rhodococcus sp. AD45]PBC43503.1 VOC family protein [Rhodococcus sp. ACPA4]PSR42901.1 VOC family protein [Rhodococcus sp. AD45-ID]
MTTKSVTHSLHHVNFPTSDLDATEAWYGKVFEMTRVHPVKAPPKGTMLLTRGNFDLHFRPVEKGEEQTGLIHFAIEVEDWDEFIAHLDKVGEEYIEEPYRGHDLSKTGSVVDPDGHRVEFTWHPDRTW